jgi:hypothetical protein
MQGNTSELERGRYHVTPVEAGQCETLLPEWGTIEDTCRIFSLGRTKIYSYLKRGLVQGVCLREPGKGTGKRLIYLESVRKFLMSQMKVAEPNSFGT